eukprot:Skav213803  [mRNA]  locus=scaffold1987:344843:347904:- [translate_table: standard]
MAEELAILEEFEQRFQRLENTVQTPGAGGVEVRVSNQMLIDTNVLERLDAVERTLQGTPPVVAPRAPADHPPDHLGISIEGEEVEVLMQGVFVGIAANNFLEPVVSDQTLADALQWRRSSAHALKEYDAVIGKSLAERVCSGDKSLHLSGRAVCDARG